MLILKDESAKYFVKLPNGANEQFLVRSSKFYCFHPFIVSFFFIFGIYGCMVWDGRDVSSYYIYIRDPPPPHGIMCCVMPGIALQYHYGHPREVNQGNL